MTTEQRERLVGQVFLGVSVDTAMDGLGISAADLRDDPALVNLLENGGACFTAELHRLLSEAAEE